MINNTPLAALEPYNAAAAAPFKILIDLNIIRVKISKTRTISSSTAAKGLVGVNQVITIRNTIHNDQRLTSIKRRYSPDLNTNSCTRAPWPPLISTPGTLPARLAKTFGSDFCKRLLGSTFETPYPNALSCRLIPKAVTTTSLPVAIVFLTVIATASEAKPTVNFCRVCS
mgnify:CR=1 FL=1